jgi:hypothetical protein
VKTHPLLLRLGLTSLAALALVIAIRAMIPRHDEHALPEPSSTPIAPANDPREFEPDVPSGPIIAAPRDTATPVVTQDDAPPSTPPEPEPPSLDAASATLASVDLGFAPIAPIDHSVTPEPIESIRADVDRLRTRIQELATRDAGARIPALSGVERPMLGLVVGASLVRRLVAGDPAFAEQVSRYREALGDAGALDPASRAALRARMFDAAHADRAALYDELLQVAR